jgi:hypothetical protein
MNFYLPVFNFTLVTQVELKAKPVACIEVPLQWFQGIFDVQVVGGERRYLVNQVTEELYLLNLAYASLFPAAGGSGAVVLSEPDDMYVYLDAGRYLAKTLLGVADEAVFSNFAEMAADMKTKSGMGTETAPGAMANIKTALLANPSYMTDAASGNANICREIYRQMPDSRKPVNSTVVFEDGDALCFNYECDFSGTAVTRAYTLKFRMRTTVNPDFNGIP